MKTKKTNVRMPDMDYISENMEYLEHFVKSEPILVTTVDELKLMFDRYTPKDVVPPEDHSWERKTRCRCPTCNAAVSSGITRPDRICRNCGQHLKYSWDE